MTDDTDARLAVLEANTARALEEIEATREHLRQILEQTGCTVDDNIETDKAMRAKFLFDKRREAARKEARRDLAAGLGILSTLIGILIAIGHAVRTLWPSGPWGGM
jgi:hypothetical protein